MTRRRSALVGVVGAAMLTGVWVWLSPQFAPRENAAVAWALRLPKERARARLAGFTGTKRVVPKVNPATDAGADWVLLDAQMRANAPDGKLPGYEQTGDYANPGTRRKTKREPVLKTLARFRQYLREAERVGRKPYCTLPIRVGKWEREGQDAAVFLGTLGLVAAVEAWRKNDAAGAMRYAQVGLLIGKQLQTQNTASGVAVGLRLEQMALRVVREGLTDPDTKRRAWSVRAFAPRRDLFLRPAREEPMPSVQLRAVLLDDYRCNNEDITQWRKRKYKPSENVFEKRMPLVQYVNRLNFFLGRKMATEAHEAVNNWGAASLAVCLRGCEREARPYALWKATYRWSDYADREIKSAPIWLDVLSWDSLVRRRVGRDTDRALTLAVWQMVSRSRGTVPDDPFAATGGVPLQRRGLPSGATIWYSVGVNGKDNGGDWQKDWRVVVPSLPKER